ncbi:Probable type I restriction enzyme BthVORF4518P M protein [Anaerobutyricum hallii]|uniref:site-specific DNA-methyltransferase (adenine-specific) n=1 Tax=Anaerobutyricum hallii TaxID=39488 RepID=A0A173UF73_9FIRM|nr:N-6 DNA methylase [Anaerobutyricum hallii]CUN13080.1 Probable type I restriction enzyme BthVORF4518P M protein [Anaerobutyricum hallii]
MLTFDVKRKINTLRDILVGKVPDPKAQVEQITIALIYKFMDDMDIEGLEFGGTRQFFSGEYEKYAWTEIMKPENSGQQRALLYAEGIEKMATNPNLPQLFRDIFRGAYIPYRDPDTLNMFLKEVSDFSYDNSEDLGNAFEYLLSIMGSQGDAGQFRTPRHIIDMMVEIVDPKKNETILDPACGTAGFLISAYRHILAQNKDEDGKSTLTADDRKRLTENFAGYDISPDMVRLSRVNMYLHHFTKPKISEYDTLTSEEKWDDCYDVILANPPFMTPKGGIMPHSRYRVKAKRSEVLFVDYIAEHLNPTGRAAIIVPEGIVFQSANAYKELRKYLVDDGLLYAVISLPAGVFNPYSGVKTSILLIDKSFARLKDEILFVKLNNDGFDLGAQRREIEGSEIPEIIRIIQKYHSNIEAQTSDEEIIHHPLVIIANKEKIAEQDYILVGERYKIDKPLATIYPVVPLSDICEINAENKNPALAFGDDEFIYIDISSVENGTGKIDFSNKIKGSDAPSRAKRAVKKGDILFSTVRPNLKAYGYVEREDCDCCIASTGFAVISAKTMVLSKYVYYMLYSEPVQTQLASMMGKGAYPSVNQKDVSQIQIPLPPLSVQEAMVTALDNYHKIIDGSKQVVDNYKPTIQYDSSWNKTKVGDVVEFISGVTLSVGECEDTNGIPLITIADVTEDGYIKTDEIRKVLTDKKVNYLQRGDLLFNWRNGSKNLVGKTALFDMDGDYIFASFLLGIRPNTQKILSEFLWIVLNQYRVEGRYMQFMRQNVNGLFNREELKDVEIPCPPLDVQKGVVDRIFNEIRLVLQNKQLMSIFAQKSENKLSQVWGEKQ